MRPYGTLLISFDVKTGERIKSERGVYPPKFQEAFGQTVSEFAAEDKRNRGVTDQPCRRVR